jgi:hypothetical protein
VMALVASLLTAPSAGCQDDRSGPGQLRRKLS